MTTAPSTRVPDDKQPLILSGARVLDSAGERLLSGHDVLVSAGRILRIAPAAQIHAPPDALRIDLTGLTLIPGLMDLHSHLLLHPYDRASWDDQVLRESLELRTIQAVVAAAATVEAGFTTLRDLGTEGAGVADVALRDAIARRLIPGPRLYVATRAIVATGCYGPAGFDPRWDVPQAAQVADGIDGIRRVVRQQVAEGADWVKVYTDYRRRPTDPPTPTFSQEELDALVYEARSAGRPTSAHAATDEGIRRAVLAGIDTIEHGYYASTEVLGLMQQRGTVLCPTLAASEALARYSGWREGEPDPPRIQAAKTLLARALAAGVTIVNGSDVGVFAHGDNARELELMAAYGMTPRDAVRAATITAARTVGRAADLGRIEAGYVADLVAVRGDPLVQLGALRNPLLVIKDGAIVVDRLEAHHHLS